MKVKSLKPGVSRRIFCIFKFALGGCLCFLILHYTAISFNPTYHHNITKQFDQVKFDVQKMMRERFQEAQRNRLEIEPEYANYAQQLGLSNPGEFGAAVLIPENISEAIKKKVSEGYDRHGFNAFVSNLISVDRDLLDTRSEECKIKTYNHLPKCTVIVPFHNEEWTLLLRTVHGVMNRSPDELLEEILLVDDASDRG